MWLHSVLSTVTTIWQMQKHCWNLLHAASVISTDASIVCACEYNFTVATFTTAGSGVKGMDKLFDFANRMSPLGNATADECADYCIVMFSDLTRKVTMQNLFHDGGFSSVGMSLRAMATYEKGLDEYMDENGNIIYG